MKVAVLGSGPSGLVAANYLQLLGAEDVTVISAGSHGFDTELFNEVPYRKGQRTFFCDENLDWFFGKLGIEVDRENLTDSIAVRYGNGIYNYPIQNNLQGWDRIKMYMSYLLRDRKLAKNNNFADWVVGTYGQYLSKNVILPHTWKTIKEDLWSIEAQHYGKKVVPISLFSSKQKTVHGYNDSDTIINHLVKGVKKFVKGTILEIRDSSILVDEELVEWDRIINTIALPKFMNLINYDDDVIDVATKSLHYNNMFIAVLVVPTKFINLDKKILYFPERKYIFSKVNIDRLNGYSVIACEISFRRNDNDLYKSKAYREKILDRVEADLKEADVLHQNMFAILDRTSTVISPAYIICDEEYDMYNTILQTFLERRRIYNVGRFSMWQPNLRVEHSLARIDEIAKKLFPEQHKRLYI